MIKYALPISLLLTACTTEKIGSEWSDIYQKPRNSAVPLEVRKYIKERQLCDHFLGEYGDDNKERQKFIEKNVNQLCTGTDQKLERLLKKYAEDPVVIEELREFKTSIQASLVKPATLAKENHPMFRKLNDQISVSPQISVADIETAKADGVTLIINNRPDGEDPDAPQSSDIEGAARAAGLKYVAIPIGHSGFSGPQVDAMIAALADGDKTLAYCRSGTRSTLLWSLAQAKLGKSPDEIARQAGNAGYDITPVRAMINALVG